MCNTCDSEYHKCSRCPSGFEFVENDKGVNCWRCDKFFCAPCWQDSGKVHKNDKYVCEQCLERVGTKRNSGNNQ